MNPIELKVLRLPHATDLPLPARQTAHAAGFDLLAAVDSALVIEPMRVAIIPCGIAVEIPPGYEMQVRPRSGLSSKHGITLVNAVGTVDADYRGEIKVPLINLGREPFAIERGMRIAQFIISKLPDVNVVEVNELSDTERGHKGFGHTGHR